MPKYPKSIVNYIEKAKKSGGSDQKQRQSQQEIDDNNVVFKKAILAVDIGGCYGTNQSIEGLSNSSGKLNSSFCQKKRSSSQNRDLPLLRSRNLQNVLEKIYCNNHSLDKLVIKRQK